MKKANAICFTLFLSLLVLFSFNDKAYAATNVTSTTKETAQVVQFGEEYSASWENISKHDYYYVKVTVPEQGILTADFSKLLNDEDEYLGLYFFVYDKDWTAITCTEFYDAKKTMSERYAVSVGLEKGEYYVVFKPNAYADPVKGGTNFIITFEPNKYCETERNETIGTADTLVFGQEHIGFYGEDSRYKQVENQDFWKINLVSGEKYTFRVAGDTDRIMSSSAIIYIHERGENNKVSFWNNAKKQEDGTYILTYTAKTTGEHLVKVYNCSDQQFKYILSVNAPINGCSISLSSDSFTYTGKPIKPEVTIKYGNEKLVNGVDYTVSYENNTNAGTAKIVINGKGKYTGTVEKEFTIKKPSIAKATVTLSTTKYTYNGKAKKPAVTVKLGKTTLKKNTDYTVSYKNNKNIGKATVTIKGKGKYTGSLSKTYTISAKKGTTFTYGAYKYKVTSSSAVAFTGLKSAKTTKVEVPKTVKYGGATFKVTEIADKALKGKTKVTKVTIGANVKVVGDEAFSGCTKLSGVTLGKAVTTIENKAFYKCTALKSITIPGKVTKIDKQAFSGCKNLKKITIKSTGLKTIGKQSLKGIHSNAIIKVPSKKYSNYKTLLKGKGQSSSVKVVKY